MTMDHLSQSDLEAWLDGERELGPEQRQHIETCPACTARLAEERNLRALSRLASPAIPTDRLWTKIEAELAAAPPPRPVSRWLPRPRLAIPLGVAVSAVLLMWLSLPGSKPRVRHVAGELLSSNEMRDSLSRTIAGNVLAKVRTAPADHIDTTAVFAASVPGAAVTYRIAVSGAGYTLVALGSTMTDRLPSRPGFGDDSSGGARLAPRPRFVGRRVVVFADHVSRPDRHRLLFSGHLRIYPVRVGVPVPIMLDGTATSLHGRLEADGAQLDDPGEHLSVSTRATGAP